MNFLRWIALLPGSLICAILSAFPVHLILYQTLTGSGLVKPYPEQPERLIGPLVAALTVVWVGSRIAPSRKIETAALLFGSILFFLGGAFALGLTGTSIGNTPMSLGAGGFGPAGAIVGAMLGLSLAYRESSERASSAKGSEW